MVTGHIAAPPPTCLRIFAALPLHSTGKHRRSPLALRSARTPQAATELLLQRVEQGWREEGLTLEEALSLADAPLDRLASAARVACDAGHSFVTFSPKVFLPLTRLCRDACGYCTFALPPVPGRRCYMTVDEVVAVAAAGAEQGASEALFTLGDKPEALYPEAAAELASMGYTSTLQYVQDAAAAVLGATGLLPHVNAGVMDESSVAALRRVSASQGLMLESSAARLGARGGPHHGCPDKEPAARLATIAAAGAAAVPFTSGILIGIGETRAERLHALNELKQLHARYGHIQELIIQPFRAKKGTMMAAHAEPPLSELLWTVALARLMFGAAMSIQAPPNLTADAPAAADDSWRALLDAGVNDWGGVSPVTRDYVNPEKPWPHLTTLAAATAAAGLLLLPRLPVYPSHMSDRWLDASGGAASVAAAVWRAADAQGLLRASTWAAGKAIDATDAGKATDASRATNSGNATNSGSPQDGHAPASASAHGGLGQGQRPAARDGGQGSGQAARKGMQRSVALPRKRLWKVAVQADGLLAGAARPAPSLRIANLLSAVLDDGHALTQPEMVSLFSTRGADFDAVCAAADTLRARVNGDTVTYVVNRNINYTNVCTYKCSFCAFSKGRAAEELRGPAYLLPLAEVERRVAEAWERGATEVCMQGGIHPDFTGDTYLRLLATAKSAAPDIHVHAFSPLEVAHGAATLRVPLRTFLRSLRDAGLGSLPGTAAEVLTQRVRSELCPDKLSSAEWLEVVATAHEEGLRSTSTIMFGHIDGYEDWAAHLGSLRALAEQTGGISEFVPLPFVHMEAPIYLKGRARRGPTLRESVLMHAVARLALHPHVTNIQASWVKLGPAMAAQLLAAGCNDMGGSIMNESITRAAGATFGQELPPSDMEALIHAAGRRPCQRTTLYGTPPSSQTERSRAAAPLRPLAPVGATEK